MFPNTGNMGLPISLYAFGEHGLALAVAFFLTLSIVQFTIGMAISGTAASLKALLRNPIVISLAGAMPIIFLDFELPRWLANTADLLGGMTIPLMLLTLGYHWPAFACVTWAAACCWAACALAWGLRWAGQWARYWVWTAWSVRC